MLAAVLLAQMFLLGRSFPLSEIFSDKHLLYIDHPYHLYQIELAKSLARDHKIIGYDPYFEAGYIGGITTNLSAMSQAVFAWLTSSVLTTTQAYKLYVVLVSLVAPLFIVFAGRASGLVKLDLWLAGMLSLLMWWASSIRWYFSAGMTASTLAGFFSVAYCLLLYRHLTSDRLAWNRTVGLGLAACLFLFIHPQFLFPVAVFALVFLFHIGSMDVLTRSFPHLILLATIALTPNLIWLIPKIHALTTFTIPHIFQASTNPSAPFLELLGIWNNPSMGSKLYPLLLLSSIWALIYPANDGSRQLNKILFLSWFGIAVFAYFGAIMPKMAMIQPNRLAPVAYLFLIPVASRGILLAFKTAIHGQKSAVKYWAVATAAFTLLVISWAATETMHEASPDPGGRYGTLPPEVQSPGEITRQILDWIDTNTTDSGRILFETSLARIHDRGHVAGYLALHSKREFIGGPYTVNEFAEFWDGHVFKKPILAIDKPMFMEYMRLFNIGWAIVHSTESKQYLDGVPGVSPVATFGNIKIYTLQHPLSYVVSGCTQSITRSHNRLVIERCKGDQRPIVLKYHFVEGIKSSDDSKINAVHFMDDPRPFIEVGPGAKAFELSL